MPNAKPKRKVLLIGWDAADWEHIDPLIEAGELPTLNRLINEGTMGNLATLQPVLSPMLWNSVATGKYPQKHGVHGFIEPDPINGGARPCSAHSRKVKALWNIFTQSGLRSNVIGWWASHPAEKINGTVVTNAFNGIKMDPETGWKLPKGSIHPQDRADFYSQLKVFPNELTHEHILPFIPNAEKIDQETDIRLEMFAKTLAETATIQSIATAVMELDPWDFMAVYFSAIDHFCHGFMQYHPPQMPNTKDEDYEIYKDVIVGAYKFHDMMLERKLALAGPDTTVIICSDHGFHSRNLRPLSVPREPAGPAIWHRQYGMLLMHGPGIKKDERIYGASLIDIAPTILALFGLPVGEDMDGRVLVEAFEEPPEIETIPSWEDVPGECGMHGGEEAMDKAQAEELMQQFAALGYIDDPGEDKEKQARDAAVEEKYNVARSYLWLGQNDEALKLFEEIVHLAPWESRFLSQLADCYAKCGYFKQAERLLQKSFDLTTTPNPTLLLTWAKIKSALRQHKACLQSLRRAEALSPRNPGISVQLGDEYLKQRRPKDAERVYARAVALHDESAMGWQGLSTVRCRQHQNQEAADAALNAVALLHRLPRAHFNLGVAMARSKQAQRAIFAFETALQFSPGDYNAHRWLAAIYRSQLKDEEKAAFHKAEAKRLREEAGGERNAHAGRRDQLFDLPEIAPENERYEILMRERPDPHNPKNKSGKTFVLVSGLPRSGTSLMMQMLAAGGMDSLTDGEREADSDNPKGYFEWEPLKQIKKNPKLLDEEGLEARAIKAVSVLLEQMPPAHDYKVIFMTRPIEEVVASQEKMVEHRGTDGADLDPNELQRGLEAHRQDVLGMLKKSRNMSVLVVDYPGLVRDPAAMVPAIVEFLGEDRISTPDAMVAVVDAGLHRQRIVRQQDGAAQEGEDDSRRAV